MPPATRRARPRPPPPPPPPRVRGPARPPGRAGPRRGAPARGGGRRTSTGPPPPRRPPPSGPRCPKPRAPRRPPPRSVQPLPHGDGGPLACAGADLEVVHERLACRQPEAQAAARAVADLHGPGDVADAGPAVPADHHD